MPINVTLERKILDELGSGFVFSKNWLYYKGKNVGLLTQTGNTFISADRILLEKIEKVDSSIYLKLVSQDSLYGVVNWDKIEKKRLRKQQGYSFGNIIINAFIGTMILTNILLVLSFAILGPMKVDSILTHFYSYFK